MEKRFEVAKIVKPQGIKGEVKLKSLVSDPSDLLDVTKVYLSKDDDNPKNVTKVWRYKDSVYMALEGVSTRNEAETLRGKNLYIDSDEARELNEDEYYITDLIGCHLMDLDGNDLGEVKEIFQNGAADVYSVKGEKNFLMPALKKVIKCTAINTKIITVDAKALSEVAIYED